MHATEASGCPVRESLAGYAADPLVMSLIEPVRTEGLGVELMPVELSDKALFEAGFARAGELMSDMTFAASFGWGEALSLRFALLDEHLCLFSAADGDLSMMLPPMPLTRSADARVGACLGACFEIMDAANARVGTERSRIEYVSDPMLERVQALSPVALSATPMPGDYVYSRKAMVGLAGGALKGKRKLRNHFLRDHPFPVLGTIRPEDVPACVGLLGKWRRFGDAHHEGEANARLIGTDVLRERDERFTVRLLENLDVLGLASMTVRAQGRLVGFTIGERVGRSMGVVYVEKTDPEVIGTPQFIYSAFSERGFGDGVREINAGDDWGIASLRFTKTSYRPRRMLGKSMLTRQAVAETGAGDPLTIAHLESVPRRHSGSSDATGGVVIRRATLDDADRLATIETLAFPADDRFTVRQVRRLIANPRARVWVAERNGVVAGWAVTLVRAHRRWRSGRVYSVAVDPALAGRGVGRALVARAVDALAGEGVTRVYLEVRRENAPAIALYRSIGFETIATLRGYYGSGTDGLRMRRVSG